jgi:acyl-CoA synthetase (AMP-forming)/AMP-acid ligase II
VIDHLRDTVDLLISSGENIYSAEVEKVLAARPEIAEVAIVDAPDFEAGWDSEWR